MSTNTDGIRTGAGMLGGAWTAPSGTTAPATPTASYGSGWEELGVLGEEGIVEASDITTTNILARNGAIVRVVKSAETVTFQFTVIETNGVISDRFYPGSTRTTSTGVTTRTRVARTGADRRAWAFDFLDGDVHTRTLIPDGEISDFGDVTYIDSDSIKYQVTLTAYVASDGSYAIDLTDDANLAA